MKSHIQVFLSFSQLISASDAEMSGELAQKGKVCPVMSPGSMRLVSQISQSCSLKRFCTKKTIWKLIKVVVGEILIVLEDSTKSPSAMVLKFYKEISSNFQISVTDNYYLVS